MDAHPGRMGAALEAYRRDRSCTQAADEHVCHPAGAYAALRNAIMSANSQKEWRDAPAWLYGTASPDGDRAALR